MKEVCTCNKCYGLGYSTVNVDGNILYPDCENCGGSGEAEMDMTEEQSNYLKFLRET